MNPGIQGQPGQQRLHPNIKYGNAQTIMHKALRFKILPWLDEGSGGGTDKETILMIKVLPGTDLPLS